MFPYLSNEAAIQVFEREAAVTEYEFVCTVIPEKIGWKSLTSGGNSGMIKVRLRIDPQFFQTKTFLRCQRCNWKSPLNRSYHVQNPPVLVRVHEDRKNAGSGRHHVEL